MTNNPDLIRNLRIRGSKASLHDVGLYDKDTYSIYIKPKNKSRYCIFPVNWIPDETVWSHQMEVLHKKDLPSTDS